MASRIVAHGGTYREEATALFGQHLDLEPLRGRGRGVVRCIFHQDHTASLSIDLDAGIFNCFGCSAQGGVRKFRELVGEVDSRPIRRGPRESEWTVAWRAAVRRGQREYAERGEWLPWLFANGTVRVMTKIVDEARRIAHAVGPDHPQTWKTLDAAARVERQALDAEAQLDGLLEEGRLYFDADDPFVAAGGSR